MRPPNLHMFLQGSLLLMLATGVLAQGKPCDQILQQGDSLGIYRVSFAEESDSQVQRRQLPVVGELGKTVSLTLQVPRGNDSRAVQLTPVDRYFQIENHNNGIYIRKLEAINRDGTSPLINDDIDEIDYTLVCTTFDKPPRQIYSPLKITITDINDNYPQFIGAPYSVVVNELTPIDTTIFRQLSATDLDSGPAKNVDFYFITGDGTIDDGTTFFAIEAPRLGYVTLKRSLDFEEMFYKLGKATYNLSIEAQDNGVPQRKTLSWIEITIKDNDDLGPVFKYPGCLNITQYVPVCINPQYTATVKSNEVNGQPMTIYPFTDAPTAPVDIRALDQDSTINNRLQYEIVSTFPSKYLTYFGVQTQTQPIGPTTYYQAILTQLRPIQRNQDREVTIVIKAQEISPNKRYETAVIRVRVDSVNQFPPEITVNLGRERGVIRENSPIGTLVSSRDGTERLQILISDPDVLAGDTVPPYDITLSNPLFSVTEDGYISLNTPNLDYESFTNPIIQLIVTVRETDTTERRVSTITLNIEVQDVNEFAPVFPDGDYQRDLEVGSYGQNPRNLIILSATDGDKGLNGQVRYSIEQISAGGVGKFFLRDTGDGSASVFANGTFQRNEVHTIIVKGEDQSLDPLDRQCLEDTSCMMSITSTVIITE